MNKKSFTLMEVIVVIVVIGILATLGFPGYKSMVENQKAKVCRQNLEALKRALDIYAMENDTLPGDLSGLPADYIRRAYAEVLRKKGAWKIKLAYFIVDLEKRGLAFAQGEEGGGRSLLTDILAGGDIKIITCPADHTPPTGSGGGIRGRSYGMNEQLENLGSDEYRRLGAGTFLIADCETPVFSGTSGLTGRHEHVGLFSSDNFAQAITKGDAIEQEAVMAQVESVTAVRGLRDTAKAPGQKKESEDKTPSKSSAQAQPTVSKGEEESWWEDAWNDIRKWSCNTIKFCF
ncbi:MAG: prepilin-type N-terminal cleavage/methylation domain-containing protein [Candidatus Omnitrophica bacterium]|nr:prepilin-type N-terminal cleavage/methylation domain-containing protein [Candidatus Omnitrophota bacterium]